MKVSSDTEAWLGVHQNDERTLHAQPYVDVGIIVLKKNADDDSTESLNFVDASDGDWARDSQLHFPLLSKGTYLIIPFTSG